MRRLVTFNRVTADGYFAAPDGNLDWVVPEDEIDNEAANSIKAFDTVLLGRRTYEMFASYWPKFADDPSKAGDPHNPRASTPAMGDMAKMLNDSTKLVFSKTLKNPTWKNSRVLSKLDPQEIESIKNQSGKDLIIFGSASIVSELTRYGLIDEYQFIVGPIFLGSGRSLISDVPRKVPLKLVEAKSYSSGNVKLRYSPAT